jgi:hypothetical protein
MTVAKIIGTGISPEQYEQVKERLDIGDSPPPGSSLHVAGRGEDGKIRIIELWETREQAEQWGEKVAAARDEAGLGAPPSTEYLEVHNILKA